VKNKSKTIKILLLIALILGTIIRSTNIEGKVSLGWDQERDLQVFNEISETGKLPLLGPVVHGLERIFYLGPLYYYIVSIPLLLSKGNPISMAYLSIALDVITALGIYFLASKLTSKKTAIIPTAIWIFSTMNITSSHTSWNVSLLNPWMILFLANLYQLSKSKELKWKASILFLISISTSIHALLLPISIISLLPHCKRFIKLKPKHYTILAISALIPQIPLIIHDATNPTTNTRMIIDYFRYGVEKNNTYIQVIQSIITKTGQTIGRLILGKPYTVLGLATTLFALLIGIKNRATSIIKDSTILISTTLILLLLYKDVLFAEYYLFPILIPILMIITIPIHNYTESIKNKKTKNLATITISTIIIGIILSNYFNYNFDTQPYSIKAKTQLLQEVKALEYPIELRIELPQQRNTGFKYYIDELKINSNPKANKKAYIFESTKRSVDAPEEARSIIHDKNIHGFRLVVFSN